MPNIGNQICGLIVLTVIYIFNKKAKHLGLYKEKIFAKLLYADYLTLAFDIISVYGIIYTGRQIPTILTAFLCKAYLVTLCLITFMGMRYAAAGCRNERKLIYIYNSLMAASFIIMFLPVSWKTNGKYLYSYGTACIVTYIVCLVFMVSTLLVVFFNRKDVNYQVSYAVIVWMILEFMALIIQFLVPEMLLVGFFSAIGILCVYLELENPEGKIDKRTGLFNYQAFTDKVDELRKNDARMSCILLKIDDEEGLVTQKAIGSFLGKLKEEYAFYIGAYCYILILKSDKDRKRDILYIENHLAEIVKSYHLSLVDSGDHGANETYPLIADYIRGFMASDISGRTESNITWNDLLVRKSHLEVDKEIDEALAEDRVEVFYQPIYSTFTNSFDAAEALVRIRKRDGSLIPPGRFIPEAEETGRISQIGDRVFEKTLMMIRDEKIGDMGVRSINVNLSVTQCEDETLADRYLDSFMKFGVPISKVSFELTETLLSDNTRVIRQNIDKFRSAGCKFSLDDFGNGGSNLNYLVDLPIDFIKIDKSMVDQYGINDRAVIILNTVVKMAKSLGQNIVAEGVETSDKLNQMYELGMNYIQGYYFSKPLPRNEYLEFIKRNIKK
jgi:EAL domain-containing protein (putative c-di-GMP-specific phosphodiesterase class I)